MDTRKTMQSLIFLLFLPAIFTTVLTFSKTNATWLHALHRTGTGKAMQALLCLQAMLTALKTRQSSSRLELHILSTKIDSQITSSCFVPNRKYQSHAGSVRLAPWT